MTIGNLGDYPEGWRTPSDLAGRTCAHSGGMGRVPRMLLECSAGAWKMAWRPVAKSVGSGIRFWGGLNLQQWTVTFSMLDALAGLCFLMISLNLEYRMIPREERKQDEANITPADYTLFVGDLPDHHP